MQIDFLDKTVIITGAAHGFGRAIALAFAARVLFLASDYASWISGQVLGIDGGR